MANGYFERGEMYDILFGDGLAGEMVAHRPGVIVSSDKGNSSSPSVLMVYTTTTTTDNKRISVNHEFVMNGWRNFALCNQLVTVNKSRIKKFYGKLSGADMNGIDECLKEAMSLNRVDTAALKAKDAEIKDRDVLIEDLRSEVTAAEVAVKKKDEEIASLKMEIEMWQKCYGRCMDMLVDTKVSSDLNRRMVTSVKPEEPVIVSKNARTEQGEDIPTDDNKVDINHCTKRDLMKIGLSEVIARAVVAARPFENVEGLKKVQGMNKKKFQILEPKVCCTPLEIVVLPAEPEEPEVTEESVGKLNINMALAKEIHEFTGLALSTCYRITKYRRDNGPYQKLEDLLNVPQVFPGTLEKLRDKIEVGPSLSEDSVEGERNEPCGGKKLNVNTATLEELMSTGMGYNAASRIRAYRNKHGNFEKLEDLLNVGRFGERALEKYRSVLEV